MGVLINAVLFLGENVFVPYHPFTFRDELVHRSGAGNYPIH